MPLQFTTTLGRGDDVEPAAPGRARLAGAGLQHGQPTAETLQVAIGAVPTTRGLHLLVDSTGIKMLSEGKWKTKKHGADHRRQWRKVHLGIDAATLEIRAMEVTDNRPRRARPPSAAGSDSG